MPLVHGEPKRIPATLIDSRRLHLPLLSLLFGFIVRSTTEMLRNGISRADDLIIELSVGDTELMDFVLPRRASCRIHFLKDVLLQRIDQRVLTSWPLRAGHLDLKQDVARPDFGANFAS